MYWDISVHINPEGQAKEVFIGGYKTGSMFKGLLDDACVLLSLLMQHGASAAEIANSLGGDEDEPASPIGLVARRIAAIEAELGDDMKSWMELLNL